MFCKSYIIEEKGIKEGIIMLPHFSSNTSLEYKSECIKERNQAIKEGLYSVIDGGFYSSYDLIIVGESHNETAIRLQHCVEAATSIKDLIEFEKETEDMYNVQVWSSTDFDLAKVLSL